MEYYSVVTAPVALTAVVAGRTPEMFHRQTSMRTLGKRVCTWPIQALNNNKKKPRARVLNSRR